MLKRFWSYIFYFTWKLHCIITLNLFEKPTMRVLRVVPYFARNLEKGKDIHRNIVDNPYCGFNIGFSFRCMLTTTTLLFASLEILIFFSLDTNLSETLDFLFGVSIPDKSDAIAFFSSTIIFSYILNEILLGWHRDRYIQYFQEFEKSEKSREGYWIAIAFHIGSAILLTILIVYFDV